MFGDNNIFESHKLNKEIKSLEMELQQYQIAVKTIKLQNKISPVIAKEEQEEYFRKRHHLKKENEDIFRIASKDSRK
jgi:cell division septum initiation protein DivIVA